MRSTSHFWFSAAAILILFDQAVTAVARINVNLQVEYWDENGEMLPPFMAGIERWDATTGQRILRYDVVTEYGSAPETVDAITVGPDGYLYAMGNNMGRMSVMKLDPATGTTTSIVTAFWSGIDLKFDNYGDLFATARNDQEPPWGNLVLGDSGIVRSFDGRTGRLNGAHVLPSGQYIGVFDFDPIETVLYTLVGSETPRQRSVVSYSYSPDLSTLQRMSEFAISYIPGQVSYHDIWCGPDGLIYLRNSYGGIDRYTTEGAYLDRFISEPAYDLTWIEGKLLALTTRSRVVEIDQMTGTFVRTLIDGGPYTGPETPHFVGMAAFSIVPEPSAVYLLISCLSAAMARPLSRKRL